MFSKYRHNCISLEQFISLNTETIASLWSSSCSLNTDTIASLSSSSCSINTETIASRFPRQVQLGYRCDDRAYFLKKHSPKKRKNPKEFLKPEQILFGTKPFFFFFFLNLSRTSCRKIINQMCLPHPTPNSLWVQRRWCAGCSHGHQSNDAECPWHPGGPEQTYHWSGQRRSAGGFSGLDHR